ncbi:MAG TPA: NusG domain II-containing protein [Clostridia bacterium]
MNEQKVKQLKSSRPFALWDIAVLALLAVAVIALLAASVSIKEQGANVRVYVNNEIFKDYDITEDGRFEITDSDGDILMFLVIKDKTAWVENSTCPDHICEMSKISDAPQQIVCLPNNVYIKVLGKSDIDIDIG